MLACKMIDPPFRHINANNTYHSFLAGFKTPIVYESRIKELNLTK